jgi:hypothetical protein
MEGVCSFETLIMIYRVTQRNITENNNLRTIIIFTFLINIFKVSVSFQKSGNVELDVKVIMNRE